MQTIRTLINFLLVLRLGNSDCSSRWPNCPKHGPNTVCTRDEDCGTKGDCKDLSGRPAFRKWMVEIHNKLRNNLALGKDTRGGNTEAANMNTISYDMDLEYVAQCHINQCDFNHDKCRVTPKFPEHAGQNLYMGTHNLRLAKNVKHVVEAWYNEIADVPDDVVDSFHSISSTQIGHFTQVVWAATTHIGCGISKKKRMYYVACNYGTGGNMVGSPLYKKGPACSACREGLTCNKEYPGLCGEITMAFGTIQANLRSEILILTLIVILLR